MLFVLFASALSLNSKSLFDSRSSKQLLKETLESLETLKDNSNLRLREILILQHKRVESELKPKDIVWYLENTQNCLDKPELCQTKNFQKDEHLNNFYTWLTDSDINQIKNSLNSINSLSWRRAKVLNLIFNSLQLGIQEVDGPNDDSVTGHNYISQLFEGSGIFTPEKELPPSRIDWAWCAAYITSIIHQAGSGFSFISLQEQINTCKEADKLEHCHPVQVEFILNWAYRKAKVEKFSLNSQIQAGDILVLINPKTKLASHIGFYLAKSPECIEEEKNNFDCQIYSVEGNAGPFINDKLEDKWPEVLQIIQEENIKNSELLLDRLTIVKRPAYNWDYIISLEP